ncbi:2-amino-4-hydroxy-6-hydroxymethyldihydropteridine diphosphokinase [Desulfomarina sp.]
MKEMMDRVRVFIGLGSNLGDGPSILQDSWRMLGEAEGVELLDLSSPYKSAPVEMSSQHRFTNGVGRIETVLPPSALLQELFRVEAAFGRKRKPGTFGYQDRPLDLDMLYYGEIILDEPELILPHPGIRERLFVLSPLVELDPGFKDPVSGESVAGMEAELKRKIADKIMKSQEIIRGKWGEP